MTDCAPTEKRFGRKMTQNHEIEPLDEDDASPADVDECVALMGALGITKAEFSAESGYPVRKMNTWKRGSGVEIPPAVISSLRSQRRLKDHGLPWRLNSRTPAPPGTRSSKLCAGERRRAVRAAVGSFYDVDEIIRSARAENRPLGLWAVDLERDRAQLGIMTVHFKRRPEGGIIPLSYERSDGEYDARVDWPHIEEAIGCIARKLEKEGQPFRAKLQFCRAKRTTGGYALWEEAFRPSVVVTILDSELPDYLVDADDAMRRLYLDLNRSRLAKFVEQTFELRLGFGDPETGLNVIKLEAAELRMANLRRVSRALEQEGA